MVTITKKEIVDRIADTNNVNRATAKQIVQAFLDEISNSLVRGNRLEFRDFGVFEVRQRAAHKAQNPKTLETVEVPRRLRLRFKASSTLKKRLDGPIPSGAKASLAGRGVS
ncbi:MAG: HU family DNA-binding protein [Phycisphaerae bacterium]